MKTSEQILKELKISVDDVLKDFEGTMQTAIRQGMIEGIIAAAETQTLHYDKELIMELINEVY